MVAPARTAWVDSHVLSTRMIGPDDARVILSRVRRVGSPPVMIYVGTVNVRTTGPGMAAINDLRRVAIQR